MLKKSFSADTVFFGGLLSGMVIAAAIGWDARSIVRTINNAWYYNRSLLFASVFFIMCMIGLYFAFEIYEKYKLKRITAIENARLTEEQLRHLELQVQEGNTQRAGILHAHAMELNRREEQLKKRAQTVADNINKAKATLLHEIEAAREWQESAVIMLQHHSNSIQKATDLKNAERRAMKLKKLAQQIQEL